MKNYYKNNDLTYGHDYIEGLEEGPAVLPVKVGITLDSKLYGTNRELDDELSLPCGALSGEVLAIGYGEGTQYVLFKLEGFNKILILYADGAEESFKPLEEEDFIYDSSDRLTDESIDEFKTILSKYPVASYPYNNEISKAAIFNEYISDPVAVLEDGVMW